jgi:cell division protein FtsA
VTCDGALLQNLVNTVNRAGMRVYRVILQNLASGEAVLAPEEREMGTAVIDIGGGTTDIAIFVRNAVRFTSAIAVGGLHFTRDLAIGLRTPIEDAERLKRNIGTLNTEAVAEDEIIEVPAIGSGASRGMPRKLACRILRDRAVELLELSKDHLERGGGREQILGGAVLTGGASLLPGMVDLAEQILEMPVRSGIPLGIHGLTDELGHPAYSTVVGLAVMGSRQEGDPQNFSGNPGPAPGLVRRVLSWVES